MEERLKQKIRQTLLTEDDLKNPEWHFQNNYLLPTGFFDELILKELGKLESVEEIGYYLYPKADDKGVIRAICLYRAGNVLEYLRSEHSSEIEFFTGQICAIYTRFKNKEH